MGQRERRGRRFPFPLAARGAGGGASGGESGSAGGWGE